MTRKARHKPAIFTRKRHGKTIHCSTEARALVRPTDRNLDRLKPLLKRDLGPLAAGLSVDDDACIYTGGAIDEDCAMDDIARHVNPNKTDVGYFDDKIRVEIFAYEIPACPIPQDGTARSDCVEAVAEKLAHEVCAEERASEDIVVGRNNENVCGASVEKNPSDQPAPASPTKYRYFPARRPSTCLVSRRTMWVYFLFIYMAAPGRGMRRRSKTTGTVAPAPRDCFTEAEDAVIVSALPQDGSARGVDFEAVARAMPPRAGRRFSAEQCKQRADNMRSDARRKRGAGAKAFQAAGKAPKKKRMRPNPWRGDEDHAIYQHARDRARLLDPATGDAQYFWKNLKLEGRSERQIANRYVTVWTTVKEDVADALAEPGADPFQIRLEAFRAFAERAHGDAFSAPRAVAASAVAGLPTSVAALPPSGGAVAGAVLARRRFCFTGTVPGASRRKLDLLLDYVLKAERTRDPAKADVLVVSDKMKTLRGDGSVKFQDAKSAGILIWSPEDFVAHLPDTLEECLARASERAAEALRVRAASIETAPAPASAADIEGQVVVITGGVPDGFDGDQSAFKEYVRGYGAEVAEQVAEGVTRVVVRGDHPSEEKLEDAEWWGIPVVDAAAFWAMLRGDGVAAAPSSSRRAPKRRRRKK